MTPAGSSPDGARGGLSAAWKWGAIPAAAVVSGVFAPILYLVLRAAEADPSEVLQFVFRPRHFWLLWNTLVLSVGVLVVGALIATPLAWLTTRSDLPGKPILTVLAVLPLAIPGYVMAYALLALTGPTGVVAQFTGLVIPRPSGYTGALIALSLYLYPYLFLNLQAALRAADPSIEESARALGCNAWGAFFRVTLPQLRPAMQSASLMVLLHVLSDFGVVSLMRYETFSYALYLLTTTSFDRVYSSWVALIMLAMAAAILVAEARLLRGLRVHRTARGTPRSGQMAELGFWWGPIWAALVVLAMVAVVLPVVAITYWTTQGPLSEWRELLRALGASLQASIPAAVLAPVLALPLVYVSVRQPSRVSRFMERIAYFGYATPPLAFGLAVTFFAIGFEQLLARLGIKQGATPWLYQTLLMLVLAYTIHFMAEAVGPIRAALYQAPPRLSESARALGYGPMASFLRVTLPLIRPGLLAAVALVFLSAMKELPLTLMLAPNDFQTLAMGVWDKTREALFAEAAPFALLIVAVSFCFVVVLLTAERPQVAAAPGPAAAPEREAATPPAEGDGDASLGLAPAS